MFRPPARDVQEINPAQRPGFEVTDVLAVASGLKTAGYEIVRDPVRWLWGLRAVVRDPDGRAVELLQQQRGG